MLKTFVKNWVSGLRAIWKQFTGKGTASESKLVAEALLQLVLLFIVAICGLVFVVRPLQARADLVMNDAVFFLGVLIFGALGYYLISRRVLSRIDSEIRSHNQFLSDASHELRTPLTIMKTNLEIALRNPLHVNQGEVMTDVLQEVSRMQKIVEDLLNLSRTYLTDPSSTDPAYTDIAVLIPELCSKLRPYAETRNVQIIYTANRLKRLGHCCVRGGTVKLSEAFLNVIRNAIEYSKPDGGEIRVVLAPGFNQTIVTKISDTGIGIAEHALKQVFSRFYQVDKTRALNEGGGSGLGLPITKSIVERYEGSIDVQSVVGKGTTVTITLPRMQ